MHNVTKFTSIQWNTSHTYVYLYFICIVVYSRFINTQYCLLHFVYHWTNYNFRGYTSNPHPNVLPPLCYVVDNPTTTPLPSHPHPGRGARTHTHTQSMITRSINLNFYLVVCYDKMDGYPRVFYTSDIPYMFDLVSTRYSISFCNRSTTIGATWELWRSLGIRCSSIIIW